MITLTKRDLGIFFLGIVLSFFLFFYQSASFHGHFFHILDHEYQQLSASIFKPQNRFSAESILVPLLGKIIGASKSAYSYQVFTALFQFAILPLVAIIFARQIPDTFSSYLALGIFASSFDHLKNYYLGFPDAVTMLCLIMFSISRTNKLIFFACLLAFLSHFTLTIFGGIAIFSILFFLDKSSPLRINLCKRTILYIAALILGKLILLTWYKLFQYKFVGRFDYAFEVRNLTWFIEKYNNQIYEFWTTPGVLFLFFTFVISVYLFFNNRKLILGQCCALIIAYLCLFLSEDGLRVFSVIFIGSYVLILTDSSTKCNFD